MLKLQTIVASTRQGRQGRRVADWFFARAQAHAKFDVELVDLAEVNLPLFDEPKHPRFRDYVHEHTKQWSATVSRGDAYVIVTPEYDHGPPAALVNALQYLVQEWGYKAAGIVSYGGVSAGTRGVAITKQILAALKVVPMFETVAIPFFSQHIDKETGVFNPGKVQDDAAQVMLDELLKWSNALKTMRTA